MLFSVSFFVSNGYLALFKRQGFGAFLFGLGGTFSLNKLGSGDPSDEMEGKNVCT